MTTNLKDLGLSTRVYNTLTKAGIETIEQLSAMSFDELKTIKGISDKSAEEIQNKLNVNVSEEKVEKNVEEVKEVKKVKSVATFKENTIYIFTKKQYIKHEGRKNYKANQEFVNKFNGRVVDTTTSTIDGKAIRVEWCISK